MWYLGLANVLVFYNTIRVMAPAFDGRVPTDKSESFIGGREKSDSPVDVAPPVAALVRPAKAFPPPRVNSIVSVDSTRALLAARYKHTYSASTSSTSSMGRPITPASDLNQMIAVPLPVAGREKSLFHLDIAAATDDAASLPAPRRSARSAVTRQPTLPTVSASPIDNGMLTAVPLKTPAGAAFPQNSQRDSFINMYASRSPAPAPESAAEVRARFVPPTLVVNDGEPAVIPSTGSASTYASGSGSEDSAAPVSAFADKQQLSASRRSFRSEVRARTSVVDVPASGLSPLAWASLVTDAATSNGGVHADPSTKTERRRSRSMDGLAVPSMLRPRVPASATLRREFTADLMPPMSAGLPSKYQNRVARWDSKATFRQGPSRTPRFSNSSDE